ncbi:hypothetical protein PCANB_001694 [Pneumocystis canis]|nr:hypothetical protein PCK1_002138 [Pneumocystis canis]KAG5440125.1 hypothetical protein PCANB_001694 [Pneumocystis canis]
MIRIFCEKEHIFLYKKGFYLNLKSTLITFSEFHNINIRWKQSLATIQRKKQNIIKQKKLKEERSVRICDPIMGMPTEFTRSILYPKNVINTKTNLYGNRANFFFSNSELDKIFELAKEANLYRVGLSLSMIKKDYLEKLKENVCQYVDITQETNIQSLLELLYKNEKLRGIHDSTNHEDKKNHIIELASISKIEKICKQEDKKAQVMKRIMSLENSNSKEIQLVNIFMAVEQFKQHGSDTGSPEVQAAVFTIRIHYLNFHLSFHHKDKNTLRALRHLVHKRQKILKYLRRKDKTRYFSCIKRLGLTDIAVMNEITI